MDNQSPESNGRLYEWRWYSADDSNHYANRARKLKAYAEVNPSARDLAVSLGLADPYRPRPVQAVVATLKSNLPKVARRWPRRNTLAAIAEHERREAEREQREQEREAERQRKAEAKREAARIRREQEREASRAREAERQRAAAIEAERKCQAIAAAERGRDQRRAIEEENRKLRSSEATASLRKGDKPSKTERSAARDPDAFSRSF